MSQIKVEITDAYDQRRFDEVLAQTVDMVLTSDMHTDTMITVRTESCFDHLTKVVTCSLPDALTFFSKSYDENAYYA